MLEKELEKLEESVKKSLNENYDIAGQLDTLIGDIEYTLKQGGKQVPSDWKRAAAEFLRITEKYI